MRGRSRGIAFSIDAAVAVMVGTVILATIASGSYRTSLEPASQAKAMAENSLASMDSSGLLAAIAGQSDPASQASIYAAQTSLLPSHLGSNVTVSLYDYTPSGSCSASCQLAGSSPSAGFCLCRQLSSSTSSNYSQAGDVTAATRVFYSPDHEYYGIAAIEVFRK